MFRTGRQRTLLLPGLEGRPHASPSGPVQRRSYPDGGYGNPRGPKKTPYETPHCNVDVVDGATLTVEAFSRDYFRRNRPVLITGAVSAEWPAWQRWSRKGLAAAYGSVKVHANEVPYANKPGSKQTLAQYLEGSTPPQP